MSTVHPSIEGDHHAAGEHFLTLDAAEVSSRFNRAPFLIGHSLVDHPLLQLPALVELARRLPEHCVEYNSGELQFDQTGAKTPRTGLGIEETLRQIEGCKSWMVLKEIERDPAYQALLDACLDQVQPLIDGVAPGMRQRRAFIFVSSPRAVTPYHVDYEHNFLLQIRGEKFMTVWDGNDRSVMSETERERMVAGGHRNLPYRDEFAAKGQLFHLEPGMGLHVPFSSPHHVKVGDHVSISLSITFLSTPGIRLRAVHIVNAFLRRHGITPRDAGISGFRDALKVFGYRVSSVLGRVGNRLRGSSPPDTPATRY